MKRGALRVATMILVTSTAAASAASVSKSIDVKEPAGKVWAMIGPFCAIKDWHPAIGQCTEADGIRTLTTKDGKAQFVEKQTANDPKGMTYTYAIEKSPLPVSDYSSTLKVTAKDKGSSTVQWTSTYTPDKGKDQDAQSAITGIYQAGLDNIQKLAGQWRGPRGLLRERAHVLVIYYKRSSGSDARIEAIRALYKARFKQRAVLRVDSTACVSF